MKNETFLQTSIFKTMVVEVLAIFVHNMPGVNLVIPLDNAKRPVLYSLNTFITIFMFWRVYLLLRLVTRFSKWRNEQAQIIAFIEGFEADTMFAIKALYYETPYLVLLCAFLFSSSILGLAVRIFELPYYEVGFIDNNVFYP